MIRGKQIESLSASKVIVDDSRMFITKEKLDQIGTCKVEMIETKAQLPNIGLENVLYVVKNDESKENHPCIYIYKSSTYEIISGGSAGNTVGGGTSNINTFSYIKEVTELDWSIDGNDKVIIIPASEHKQTTNSIIVIVFDGQEHVIVPYTIDAEKQVKIYSQSGFSGKIIVSDLVSHSHENMEVLSKFGQDERGGLLFSGEPIKGGNTGNPLTLQPLEYGYFTFNQDKTMQGIENEVFDFDNSVGNMDINEGRVVLKYGKTYHVVFSALVDNTSSGGGGNLQLFDKTKNAELKRITVVKSGSSFPHNNVSTNDIIFTPDEDTEVCLLTGYIGIVKVYSKYTSLSIQEIRNNPVNQYGGFETEVLFDGLGTVGEYVLSDDVNNYDFLFVTHEMKRDSHGDSIIPIMTSNTTPTPYVTSASFETNPAYGAFNGVVGYGDNTWYANKALPHWLNISCGMPIKVRKFSLCNGIATSGYDVYPPKTFKFQGSNDGVVYDDLLEVVDLPKMKAGEEVGFELDRVVEYSNYRWYFTEAYSNAIIIGEAKLFGESIHVENTDVIIPDINKEHHLSLYDKSTIFSLNGEKLKVLYEKGLSIKKIVGVKGQLPTALVGGTF